MPEIFLGATADTVSVPRVALFCGPIIASFTGPLLERILREALTPVANFTTSKVTL